MHKTIDEEMGFDIASLNSEDFNKKINLSTISSKILRKYSKEEITRYAVVCWYKRKRNAVIICLTNEKIFIESNKNLSINGVYSYRDVVGFRYFSHKKQEHKSYCLLSISGENYTLKGISKETFAVLDKIFENEREIFNNSKLGKSIMQNIDSISSLDFLSRKKIIEDSEAETIENKEETSENNHQESRLKDQLNDSISKKSKRVVNDSIMSYSTSFSSMYMFEILSSSSTSFPNGEKTILNDFAQRLEFLEKNNLSNNNIDTFPLKLDSKKSKLNTIPVLAEFTSLKNPNDVETRILFARNWIEFTKHNVRNKLLGVDSNGDGVYVDMKQTQTSHTIDVFKAKEYKIDDCIRHGLRSSQSISFHEKNQRLGIDSLYVNIKNGQKLILEKYDGIIFLGIKYYFNTYNEFNTLQRKYLRIFHQDKKHNGEIYRSYEIVFEDDLVSYKAFNDRGVTIDDLSQNAASYDLKWLTFFRD
ncbi:MAG: hypothetical protein HDR31_00170 [Mycoplasma sp.]|nr:hypothetical protein [Mycoplasma sp.]